MGLQLENYVKKDAITDAKREKKLKLTELSEKTDTEIALHEAAESKLSEKEAEIEALIQAADATGDTLALQREKDRLAKEKAGLAEQLRNVEKGRGELESAKMVAEKERTAQLEAERGEAEQVRVAGERLAAERQLRADQARQLESITHHRDTLQTDITGLETCEKKLAAKEEELQAQKKELEDEVGVARKLLGYKAGGGGGSSGTGAAHGAKTKNTKKTKKSKKGKGDQVTREMKRSATRVDTNGDGIANAVGYDTTGEGTRSSPPTHSLTSQRCLYPACRIATERAVGVSDRLLVGPGLIHAIDITGDGVIDVESSGEEEGDDEFQLGFAKV